MGIVAFDLLGVARPSENSKGLQECKFLSPFSQKKTGKSHRGIKMSKNKM